MFNPLDDYLGLGGWGVWISYVAGEFGFQGIHMGEFKVEFLNVLLDLGFKEFH